jgi:hypothetical protein
LFIVVSLVMVKAAALTGAALFKSLIPASRRDGWLGGDAAA